MDSNSVTQIATQVSTEADRKLDFKLTKQLQLLERDLKEEFNTRFRNIEDSLKKELNYMVLQNSLKKNIDDTMQKRSPQFVP